MKKLISRRGLLSFLSFVFLSGVVQSLIQVNVQESAKTKGYYQFLARLSGMGSLNTITLSPYFVIVAAVITALALYAWGDWLWRQWAVHLAARPVLWRARPIRRLAAMTSILIAAAVIAIMGIYLAIDRGGALGVSTPPAAGGFIPEVPKGPAARECFAHGLKELRAHIARMRKVTQRTGGVGGLEIEMIPELHDRLAASREIDAQLLGPGEGQFFISHAECKAQLRRHFPPNTQAAWNKYHTALFYYLNGLELYEASTDKDKARKNLEPLIAQYVVTLDNLTHVLSEISANLKATDDVMP